MNRKLSHASTRLSGHRIGLSLLLSALMALAASASVAVPTLAECPSLQNWPLFRDGAPSATTILTARVTQVLSRDRGGNVDQFRLQVIRVIRGQSPESFFLSGVATSGNCIPSALSVRRGDRLAIAFGGLDTRIRGPVSGVAFLSPLHDGRLMPRMERLTTRHLRQIAALPSTQLLFFSAHDGIHGRELWSTDGTPHGTRLVKDIRAHGSSDPRRLVASGSLLYFSADDGTHGRELWVTDGTALGTHMVADILPGARGSRPQQLTDLDGTVAFTAIDGRHGRELWVHEPITGETRMVHNLRPDTGNIHGSRPSDLTPVNGSLLFSADDGSHGREPWSTAYGGYGMKLCGDLRPGPVGSDPLELTEFQRREFFTADDGVLGRELWICTDQFESRVVTDDTVPVLNPQGLVSSDPHGVRADSAPLYFVADDPQLGEQLFGFDGLASRLTNLPADGPGPSQLVLSGRLLFFVAPDSTGHLVLWTSHGTADTTQPIGGPRPQIDADGLREMGGQLLFIGTDPGTGFRGSWITDGTPEGTHLAAAFDKPAVRSARFVPFRGLGVLAGNGAAAGLEPWISDGTLAGTHRLIDIRPGPIGSDPQGFTVLAPAQYP